MLRKECYIYTNSISNLSVAFEGILGGLPFFPYAYSGAQVNSATSPFFIVATPISHALITLPFLSSNLEMFIFYFLLNL